MGWFSRIQSSNFLFKLMRWEFWPFGILQGPVFVYWLWLSIKARSLFFFSASNPGILSGGMMGESKSDVLKLLPPHLIPTTVLVKLPVDRDGIMAIIRDNKLRFPLIFK